MVMAHNKYFPHLLCAPMTLFLCDVHPRFVRAPSFLAVGFPSILARCFSISDRAHRLNKVMKEKYPEMYFEEDVWKRIDTIRNSMTNEKRKNLRSSSGSNHMPSPKMGEGSAWVHCPRHYFDVHSPQPFFTWE
jgi:hypothetical protein